MLKNQNFETGCLKRDMSPNFKPPKSNAYPSRLAAVSGATHPKPNAGKVPMCELAIAAVPLRSIPSRDVIRKPQMSVSSHVKDHDEGPKKSKTTDQGPKLWKTTDNTVHENEDSWKNESDKLAAIIAEAKEFINLLDVKYSAPTTFPAVENFLIDSRESKDQLPSMESDAFGLATDVDDASHGKQNSIVVTGQPRCHAADAELGKNIQATEVCEEKERRPSNHGTNVKWGKPIPAKDVCMFDDISKGKEKFKVRVVNGVDVEPPPPFTYTTNIINRCLYWISEPIGCDCVDGCSDSVKCPCVRKNGHEIPYTEKGELMRATKKVVHECGPSCKCPPSCMNRVSQHGPRFQLEIFKTETMGWGVRSRDYISSGSFICEYIGELLNESEADRRINNDQYLFDICHGKTKEDDYALDAANFGNISRFINHSCDPNVFAQKVLYNHDDKKMPHIMFFAPY